MCGKWEWFDVREPGVSSFVAKSEGAQEKEKKGKDDDAGEEVGATWLVPGPGTCASKVGDGPLWAAESRHVGF